MPNFCKMLSLQLLSNVLLILILSNIEEVFGQVCSPIGQVCARTTECCKGCCEAYSCVDRTFPCSGDMIAQPNADTCARYYCPPEHLCFLREICPPENPCPRIPSCRRVDFFLNITDPRYGYRNAGTSIFYTISPLSCALAIANYIFVG